MVGGWTTDGKSLVVTDKVIVDNIDIKIIPISEKFKEQLGKNHDTSEWWKQYIPENFHISSYNEKAGINDEMKQYIISVSGGDSEGQYTNIPFWVKFPFIRLIFPDK